MARCARHGCDKEAEYVGTLHEWNPPENSLLLDFNRDWKEIHENLCRFHYLENDFGLWALSCTDECFENRKKTYGIEYTPRDRPIYMSIPSVIGPIKDMPKPKCPWCGKEMVVSED